MARLHLAFACAALLCIAASAQEAALSPTQATVTNATAKAPAPAPKMAATPKTPAPPPPPVYAPKRSFGQWCRDLKHDPALLIGFIVSLISGVGFLFIVYAVSAELVMAVPYMRKSYSPVSNRVDQPSPSSSMDVKMQQRY